MPADRTAPCHEPRWRRSARTSNAPRPPWSASATCASSGIPTAWCEATLELRRDISRVIRQVRPERVITQSPERNWDFIFASHPDHLAAGEAAVCAVYPDARNPFAHPELLEERGARALERAGAVDHGHRR